MPRPRRWRRVWFEPTATYFKPAGIPLAGLGETILTVEEFEAIRLIDFQGLEQVQAAKKMNISQPTFSRLLETARKKIADALVNGKAIKIQGGRYQMVTPNIERFEQGMGVGRGFGGGRRAMGPPTVCVCSACGNRQPKIRGIPCAQTRCQKCGALMVRGD